MEIPSRDAHELAKACTDLLRERQLRLVGAESCTSGLVAASLGGVPGVSEWFCGSLVVYRNASKSDWLGISIAKLDDPRIGPVSQWASSALAEAALLATPEASIAYAVTGHLGPTDDKSLDGQVFLSVARRAVAPGDPLMTYESRIGLTSPKPTDKQDSIARQKRQVEATERVLRELVAFLESK